MFVHEWGDVWGYDTLVLIGIAIVGDVGKVSQSVESLRWGLASEHKERQRTRAASGDAAREHRMESERIIEDGG